MIFDITMRYKLKEGKEPATGMAKYGTDDLNIIAFDMTDKSIYVQPEGISSQGRFWAFAHDLEPMEE